MINEMSLPPEISWINQCTSRNYYNALWATLVQLKPINCLEVGTFHYYSANIFSRYFDEYAPDGKLITLDISTWNRSPQPPKRVFPVMVYPHIANIDQFHGNIQVFHKNYKEVLKGKKDANIINSIILHEVMCEHHIDMFDFTFVDGDHCEISARADLNMAKNLTSPEGWILIDDFTDPSHEVGKVISSLRYGDRFYTYDNWGRSPDMGLILTKEFSLEEKIQLCP